MSLRGRRDSFNDGWSWEPLAGGDGPRGHFPWRALFAIILAAGLVTALVVLVILANDDGGNASGFEDTPTPSASVRPTPTRKPTPSATVSVTPSPTTSPSPTPAGPQAGLFAWARGESRWVQTELSSEATYREGDAIPMLLILDGAVPGTSYEVTLTYQCATVKGAGFDFLTSPSEADSPALSSDPAPARQPDSAMTAPSDPSIAYDDGSVLQFKMWGGTFQESAGGPTPQGICERQKQLRLAIRAASETVTLVWGAHLASAKDWGQGRGAASQDEPISITADVTSSGEARLSVAPGAVRP